MTASTDTSAPVTFESILAANNMTAEHKARLTVAPAVLKALTTSANVVVLASEAYDGTNDVFLASIKSAPMTTVIEAKDTDGKRADATRVGAHVASFAKTRKVNVTKTPLKSASTGLIGYVFRNAASA